MTGFPNFGAANADKPEPLPKAPPPEPRILERARLFGEMGFTEADADLLASAKDDKFLVHVGYVKRLLDRGASHAQVVAIIL